jgi:hypothetical protein
MIFELFILEYNSSNDRTTKCEDMLYVAYECCKDRSELVEGGQLTMRPCCGDTFNVEMINDVRTTHFKVSVFCYCAFDVYSIQFAGSYQIVTR